MKSVLTLSFSLMALVVFCQTTDEEYNYLTKGYKIQIESGLDMKKGYRIEDVEPWLSDNSIVNQKNVTFKHLFRNEDATPCATLIIFNKSGKQYFCIPHFSSDSKIWDRAFFDFRIIANDWTGQSRLYTWEMIRLISYLSSQ